MDLKLTESRRGGRRGRMSRASEGCGEWTEKGLCVWEIQWEVIQTKQAAFLEKDQSITQHRLHDLLYSKIQSFFLTSCCLRHRKSSADEQQMSSLALCFHCQLCDINICRVVAFLCVRVLNLIHVGK